MRCLGTIKRRTHYVKKQAGFARLDMTPPLGVCMCGYYFERRAEGVLDPLYLNAFAVKDGDKAAVVMVCDLEGISSVTMNEWIPLIAEKAGLPAEAIFISCTHTHTGPCMPHDIWPSDPEYDAWLFRRLCDAAVMALQDCKPVTEILAYEGDCADVAYVRRLKYRDGHYQTWGTFGDPDMVDYASEGDESLRFIRVRREDAGEIVLVNFQAHPDNVSNCYYFADFPGFLRDKVEAACPGTQCIFLNGAEGQMVCVDFLHDKERRPKIVLARNVGHTLADFVLTHFDDAKPVTGEGVSFGQKMLACRTKRDSSLIPEAQRIIDIHEKGNDAEEIGPNWVSIPLVAESYVLRKLEEENLDSVDILVSAVSVGGLAFLGISGETFCELGKAIRECSPYPVTLVCCKTNGSEGYYSTAEAYDQGGYEPRNSRFPKGIGEHLVEESLDLLREIYA